MDKIEFGKVSNPYGCFSNFYPCDIMYDGILYHNSESAWQSLKTMDKNIRKLFSNLDPSEAKREGRRLLLRKDWEEVKYSLMVDVCYEKFKQNPSLKEILLSTGNSELVENTTGWHDNTWGNCNCDKCSPIKGKNLLGKALMEVRSKMKDEELFQTS